MINKYGKSSTIRVWSLLPCFLSKGVQKQDLLDIYLTTAFGVHNFQNAWAMRAIFF